jgi:hypothetical protein
LKVIFNFLPWRAVFFLKVNGFLKKFKAKKSGFSSLPGKNDFRDFLSIDVLPDIFL